MAKWANATVLDGGSDLIRSLAGTASRVKMHLVKSYSPGDSYATVIGNSCGSVDLAVGDLVQSTVGSDRKMTVGAKSINVTANSGAAPDLHVAIVDSVSSAVLLVNDETSNQQVYSGNVFNTPAWGYTVAQPV